MTNMSHLELVLAFRRERRAGCPGRRCRNGRGREGVGRGGAMMDNRILVAMKRGLYVFFRDLKTIPGTEGPGKENTGHCGGQEEGADQKAPIVSPEARKGSVKP